MDCWDRRGQSEQAKNVENIFTSDRQTIHYFCLQVFTLHHEQQQQQQPKRFHNFESFGHNFQCLHPYACVIDFRWCKCKYYFATVKFTYLCNVHMKKSLTHYPLAFRQMRRERVFSPVETIWMGMGLGLRFSPNSSSCQPHGMYTMRCGMNWPDRRQHNHSEWMNDWSQQENIKKKNWKIAHAIQ